MSIEEIKTAVISQLKAEYYLVPRKPQVIAEDRNMSLVKQILHFVSAYYQVDPSEVLGKSRKREITTVRHMICYLTKRVAKSHISVSTIGRELNRQHASVIHGIAAIENDSMYNKQLKTDIEIMYEQFVTSHVEHLKIYQIATIN